MPTTEGIDVRGITVELSHEEYRTAWQALDLGTRPWNLDLPGIPELADHERRAHAANTLEDLRARGLADRRGMAPELEDSLRLVASPVSEINGWVQTSGAQVRLLAGSRGEWAVLAMLDEQRLLVRTGPASELCTAVARQLPDRPAGPGSSVSVPSELLAEPAQGGQPGLTGEQLENRLTRGGVKPADAQSVAAMLRGPKPSAGKFGAARRDRNGKRHPAGAALVYLATEHGGYTLQPLRGPDSAAWTTLAPATLTQLAQRIDQLLASIRIGRPGPDFGAQHVGVGGRIDPLWRSPSAARPLPTTSSFPPSTPVTATTCRPRWRGQRYRRAPRSSS
ncbi:MAG: ESX secretion-associated protein EspG [Pseudonocardiaceae bacterium]